MLFLPDVYLCIKSNQVLSPRLGFRLIFSVFSPLQELNFIKALCKLLLFLLLLLLILLLLLLTLLLFVYC